MPSGVEISLPAARKSLIRHSLAEIFVISGDGIAQSGIGNALSQIMALRPNLQMYVTEALLSWCQRLHVGKVPDLDYSKERCFCIITTYALWFCCSLYLLFASFKEVALFFALVGNFPLGTVLLSDPYATLPLCFICFLIKPLLS
ncbi:unnamed protein product [Sphenostylis stenocarpa]|uniref:Uncharacterized protein n=1 Tax=Sphenostylis stenocarpa TaxID=92480 RepID=A0AA86S563_9FABA|nr:unnamed protein product [Sphenostylis stenocarpa]